MKSIIGMLLVLGIFASYGTFTLIKNQSFRPATGHGTPSNVVTTASQDPEGFKATITITTTMAILCFLGAGALAIREKKQAKSG